ncbi:hypothetical protein Bca52824_028767 [Brassica carinata]|uniref:S1-like domain-containing protein n=1 Tax=Brassica carinata TaxID=52824 RepID=A0A8X7VDD4_BRACI|nr:hypothetical protein Bca52824_028767 [Brassica carinata]
MPKNKGKGGKNIKRGKKIRREIICQGYALVLRICEAKCIDGVTRMCHIRGEMHKKVWISGYGNIILVGLRMDMHNDSKADVIHNYTPD